MLSVKDIRKNNLNKFLKYFERKDFASIVKIDYVLLNQYIPENAPKNIGLNNAKKITEAFQLPEGWLDHEHTEEEVFRVVYKSGKATKNVAEMLENTNLVAEDTSHNSKNGYRILNIKNIIKIQRGQDLQISEIPDPKSYIFVPPSMEAPVAFEVSGTGYQKPYKTGYLIVCDAKKTLEPGDDVVFVKSDNIPEFAEFLYERDGMKEFETLDGKRLSIEISEIKYVYPVTAYYPSSQKHSF